MQTQNKTEFDVDDILAMGRNAYKLGYEAGWEAAQDDMHQQHLKFMMELHSDDKSKPTGKDASAK